MSRRSPGINIDDLIESVARSAIREAMTSFPFQEQPDNNEEFIQNLTAREVKPFRSKGTAAALRNQNKKQESGTEEDLEEAEDDDQGGGKSGQGKSDEPQEPKKPAVTKKMATGKEEPKPEAVIPDPTEIKDVTFDQVINMMNMMRSGRSTKNPDTRNSLRDYFKGLNSGERQALFVLLSGITQILAGGIPGDEAPDPSEVGIRINPRTPEKQPETLTTQRTAQGRKPAPVSQATKVPGSPDKELPIVVGEAADRRAIARRIAAMRAEK